MDNVSQALIIAFAVFVLVIGLSYSVYLLNGLNSVSTNLIRANDRTKDYQSVSFDSSQVASRGNLLEGKGDISAYRTRTVSVDDVISTIYRYNKENFSVEIRDFNGTLNQVFDMEIEGIVSSGKKTITPTTTDGLSDDQKAEIEAQNQFNENYNQKFEAFQNLYGKDDPICLYGAPWKSDDSSIKQRIDLYVSSQCGYINNTKVDYSTNKNNLKRGLKNMLQSG